MNKNRLANETSPYLLQHATNPVDWFPWGDEALELARSEDRPILLSIGYSACHWCHVMERECFENEDIAALMNQHFVNIKVDREERPDLDQLYQTAVQVLGGQGGWPLTVFLTPDLEPFFGGTYFPPVPRHGLRSFPQVLNGIAEAWRERREDVNRSAEQLVEVLGEVERGPGAGEGQLRRETVVDAARALVKRFDSDYGGFGDRPKFPNTVALELWLRMGAQEGGAEYTERVLFTALRMIAGGIHDQIGGGFHRYSVDERWLVPHFEKMLYDNALILRLFARLYRQRPEPVVAEAAAGIVDWLLREMTSPDGGFYATQDADTEGEEGRFFVWDEAELVEVLGESDANLVARLMGVIPGGNFEHGKSVLHRAMPLDAAAKQENRSVEDAAAAWMRAKPLLFEARERRPKPQRDDKILAGWNGLMIQALAEAGRAFGQQEWISVAVRASDFADTSLHAGSRLHRVFIEGSPRIHAFAEDHAFLAEGELALFEVTGDPKHFERAKRLVDDGIRLFSDPEGGPFFLTPNDGEKLLQRPRAVWDNAVPAATSSFLHSLLQLHALTGEGDYADLSDRVLLSLQTQAARQPFGFGHLLGAMDAATAGVGVLVVGGRDDDPQRNALLAAAVDLSDPNILVVPWTGEVELPPGLDSLLAGKDPSVAAAFLCRDGTCSLPAHSAEDVRGLLSR